MQTTENLGLRKPEENDFYDVNDFNNNADALDALFEKDANGDVAAKNAKTLDGHGAEYFAPLEGLSRFNPKLYETSSEAEYDELLANLQNNAKDNEWYRCIIRCKVMHSILGGYAYYVEGFRRIDGYGYQRLTSYIQGAGLMCFERSIYGGTWGKWVNPLTTAGGTIEAPSASVAVKSTTTGRMFSFVSDNIGRMGLYDNYNGKWVVQVNTDNTVRVFGVCDGNFPLNGSGTVKEVYTKSVDGMGEGRFTKAHNATVDYGTTVQDIDKDGKMVQLRVRSQENRVEFVDRDAIIRTLLHTGNKPQGSYTGNGDATERVINTGGVGSILAVWGGGAIVFLTASGITGATNNQTIDYTLGKWINGNYIMNTDNVLLNRSGIAYSWVVL